MKKLVVSLFIIFSFSMIHAQKFVSSYYQEAKYDHQTEQWVLTTNTVSSETVFEFSEKGSIMKRITPTATTTYTIKSVFNNKTQIEYEMVNEKGEEFILIIDTTNLNLRIISIKAADWRMTRYTLNDMK